MKPIRNIAFTVIVIWLVIALMLWAKHAHAATYPNATLTPGANLASDIRPVGIIELCSTSTRTVRDVTEAEKHSVYTRYGLAGDHAGYCSGPEGCEIDHLCSLELGCTNDVTNLWPQSYSGQCNAHQKDKLENKLHALVCKGSMPLATAQKLISTNWVAAYVQYVDPKGCM